jgi:hypothetical protein
LSKLILTEIWIYPIKSLPGIQVTTGTVMQKGMKGDRRFMLIDQDNRFITQRNHPRLSQFNLSYDSNKILVTPRGSTHQLSVPTEVNSKLSFPATIWNDTVEVVEVSPESSQWFSDALNMGCRLVYFPEKNERRINPEYVREEQHVGLADAYPYLIIGRNSLRDLNKRTSKEMVMKRFRPNLVFEGGEPYAEDSWSNFRIGDVVFTGVKPCDRCVLTTVDPETGIKGDEPLRTLSTYRKVNGSVYFGQNVIAQNEGKINEREEIIVL